MSRGLRVGSLMSGIGGVELGLERAGFGWPSWFCERDAHCRLVLARHWPGVHIYRDVRDVNADAPKVDLLTAGFPCQPVSDAGKKLGVKDERWLWPEVARILSVLRPRLLLVENVRGLRTRGLCAVLCDLAALGYDAEWGHFGACCAGARHERVRLWLLAYPHADGERLALGPERDRAPFARSLARALGRDLDGLRDDVPDAVRVGRPGRTDLPTTKRAAGRLPAEGDHPWSLEPALGRVAHGVPRRVDRLRGLGNAVCPPCAELLGRVVLEVAAKLDALRAAADAAGEGSVAA